MLAWVWSKRRQLRRGFAATQPRGSVSPQGAAQGAGGFGDGSTAELEVQVPWQ